MGGGSSIQYTIPVTQKPEGESAVYRLPEYKHKLLDRPEEHLLTMKDVLINTYKKYGSYEALGISFYIQDELSEQKKMHQLNI
jgi:long-chain acyl-CoA synthetase